MPERVALIIPALNEEQSIGSTLAGLKNRGLGQVIVVDNGSTDRTAEVAQRQGARVIREPRRGYGYACLAGMANVRPEITAVGFMDADGSDDPDDLARLLEPIRNDEADLVIGSRATGPRESGALTPHQHFGNWLATRLMRLFYGVKFDDLGPFRVIRRDAIEGLGMRDTNYGWTIEMQIRAHRRGLRVLEIPVRYRKRRAGASKVSGSLRGSIGAGVKIIWTILKLRFS